MQTGAQPPAIVPAVAIAVGASRSPRCSRWCGAIRSRRGGTSASVRGSTASSSGSSSTATTLAVPLVLRPDLALAAQPRAVEPQRRCTSSRGPACSRSSSWSRCACRACVAAVDRGGSRCFVIGGLGLWDPAMITVALILVSVAHRRSSIGVPLGILSARRPAFERAHARAPRRDAGDARVLLPAAVRAALRHRLPARGGRDGHLRAARRDPAHAARAPRRARPADRGRHRARRDQAPDAAQDRAARSRGPRCCSA